MSGETTHAKAARALAQERHPTNPERWVGYAAAVESGWTDEEHDARQQRLREAHAALDAPADATPYVNLAWERAAVGGLLQASARLFATFLPEYHDALLTDPLLRGIVAAMRASFGETGRHDLGAVYLRCHRAGLAVRGETFDHLVACYHGGDAPLTGYLDVLRDYQKQRAARGVRETPAAETGQGSLDAIDVALATVPVTAVASTQVLELAARAWLRSLDASGPRTWSTGLPALDTALGGGLAPGRLVVIGARTSQGKSVMALRLARGVAESTGRPVLVHALEMTAGGMVGRLVADAATLENSRVQHQQAEGTWTADEYPRFHAAAARVMALPLHFRTTDAVWADHLAAYARFRAEHPDQVALVVDYLGLIRGVKAERRYQELGLIVHALKQFAVAAGITMIAVSQVNRAAAGQDATPPGLHHLRESGDIEQDADVVLLLHQPSPYAADPVTLSVDLAKNRDGPLGSVSLAFDRRYCRIEDAA